MRPWVNPQYQKPNDGDSEYLPPAPEVAGAATSVEGLENLGRWSSGKDRFNNGLCPGLRSSNAWEGPAWPWGRFLSGFPCWAAHAAHSAQRVSPQPRPTPQPWGQPEFQEASWRPGCEEAARAAHGRAGVAPGKCRLFAKHKGLSLRPFGAAQKTGSPET